MILKRIASLVEYMASKAEFWRELEQAKVSLAWPPHGPFSRVVPFWCCILRFHSVSELFIHQTSKSL